jgi:hypothetical protein
MIDKNGKIQVELRNLSKTPTEIVGLKIYYVELRILTSEITFKSNCRIYSVAVEKYPTETLIIRYKSSQVRDTRPYMRDF